jgi:hypothetical protein
VIPDGFEIYENPDNAQVFLRRAKPTLIQREEREAVNYAVRNLAGMRHFIVDVEDDALIVYTPNQSEDSADEQYDFLANFATVTRQAARDFMLTRSRYSRMMRFTLVEPDKRLFQVERWCFKGSIDDWFYLAGEAPLQRLLKQYIPHLGRESFFELF